MSERAWTQCGVQAEANAPCLSLKSQDIVLLFNMPSSKKRICLVTYSDICVFRLTKLNMLHDFVTQRQQFADYFHLLIMGDRGTWEGGIICIL